jgi:hypothetical protein
MLSGYPDTEAGEKLMHIHSFSTRSSFRQLNFIVAGAHSCLLSWLSYVYYDWDAFHSFDLSFSAFARFPVLTLSEWRPQRVESS